MFKNSQEDIHSTQEEHLLNVSSLNDKTLEAADSLSVDDFEVELDSYALTGL